MSGGTDRQVPCGSSEEGGSSRGQEHSKPENRGASARSCQMARHEPRVSGFFGRAATWVGAHPPCRGVRRSEAREVAAGAERPFSDEAWSGSHAAGVRPDEKSAACAILNRASRPHGAVWLGTRTGQQSRRGAADQLAMVSVSAGPRDPRSSQALPNRPGGSHGVRTDMRAHQGAPVRLDPNPPYCVVGRKVPSRRPVGGIGVCRDTINVDGEIVSEGGRPKRHLRWSTSPLGRYTLGSELLR